MALLLRLPLEKVSIAAALLGKTSEQLADEQRQDALIPTMWSEGAMLAEVCQALGLPLFTVVMSLRQNGVTEAAMAPRMPEGVFTPHVVDEAALARARSKCREIVAADPAAYSYVIPSEPLPDQDKPGGANNPTLNLFVILSLFPLGVAICHVLKCPIRLIRKIIMKNNILKKVKE
ncbi:hypothetical protein [Klebsiella quasipneumoniae]|uniref:hypothetical protein n=1 Tax=Klebsiella quasipneumoniae TaxID=1463165 RepID=UPI0023E340CF|nr:hypothetical protein [Klebsiella quasipneumoniae]